ENSENSTIKYYYYATTTDISKLLNGTGSEEYKIFSNLNIQSLEEDCSGSNKDLCYVKNDPICVTKCDCKSLAGKVNNTDIDELINLYKNDSKGEITMYLMPEIIKQLNWIIENQKK
ncbi:MAG: hypothetical protein MHPSP_004313, partial [Paramarteilia canceri]